jgi:hypothetical protein
MHRPVMLTAKFGLCLCQSSYLIRCDQGVVMLEACLVCHPMFFCVRGMLQSIAKQCQLLRPCCLISLIWFSRYYPVGVN